MGNKRSSLCKLVIISCVGVLMSALSGSASADSDPRVSFDLTELTQVATENFHKSAQIMVDGYDPSFPVRSVGNEEATKKRVGGRSFEQAIEDYRRSLEALGETYSDSRTQTSIDSFEVQSDGTIRARATETTYLTISGGDTETGYTALHELTFALSSTGEWSLAEDQYLEPTGLLPLGEAESLVVPTAEYFDSPVIDRDFSEVEPAATTRLASAPVRACRR